jgi:hypothetical protein
LIPLEEALGATLRKLGLAEPAVMLQITGEWGQVAGEPWASRAVPLYLRSGVLVVETLDRGGAAFLRYGVTDLERRLTARYGGDTIRSVEVRPPSSRPMRAVP